jgi:hypothetical protein
MFVSLALSEFIGIMGLVLFFLGDNFQVLYTFMANSPNHTSVYIPSGVNGIPLVKTVE